MPHFFFLQNYLKNGKGYNNITNVKNNIKIQGIVSQMITEKI